jgi:hypothetical protein
VLGTKGNSLPNPPCIRNVTKQIQTTKKGNKRGQITPKRTKNKPPILSKNGYCPNSTVDHFRKDPANSQALMKFKNQVISMNETMKPAKEFSLFEQYQYLRRCSINEEAFRYTKQYLLILSICINQICNLFL